LWPFQIGYHKGGKLQYIAALNFQLSYSRGHDQTKKKAFRTKRGKMDMDALEYLEAFPHS
jgi:hypothetical protein